MKTGFRQREMYAFCANTIPVTLGHDKSQTRRQAFGVPMNEWDATSTPSGHRWLQPPEDLDQE